MQQNGLPNHQQEQNHQCNNAQQRVDSIGVIHHDLLWNVCLVLEILVFIWYLVSGGKFSWSWLMPITDGLDICFILIIWVSSSKLLFLQSIWSWPFVTFDLELLIMMDFCTFVSLVFIGLHILCNNLRHRSRFIEDGTIACDPGLGEALLLCTYKVKA